MKVAVGRCPETGEPVASQSTISRMENSANRTDAARLAVALVDQFCATVKPGPIEVFDNIQIRAGGAMRPSLDIQLKATINLGEPKSGAFRFPLKRRNYDLLLADTMIPRILVVLDLPKSDADQTTASRLERTRRFALMTFALMTFALMTRPDA
jgi:hypothetical protein